MEEDYAAIVEVQEELCDSDDFITERKSAAWTKDATTAMLNLYEEKIQKLIEIGKQSQVWKIVSDSLKESGIEVTADQVKWKFNRLNTKYKKCVENNSIRGRYNMTFEYYDLFERLFHKEKEIPAPWTYSAIMFAADENKRKREVIELKHINIDKRIKLNTSSSININDPLPVDEPPKSIRNIRKRRLETVELLKHIQENQTARDEKMTKYLEMKQKELELKKKAIAVREAETQIKKDIAREKLKFNEKKHKDWLSIEKLKCELLKKLFKDNNESEVKIIDIS